MMGIVKDLTELVMNERQSKIYCAILMNNKSTSTDLHRITGLALNKTYETLKYLCIQGFCTKIVESNKTMYAPTDPALVFKTILDDKKGDLKRTELLLQKLCEIYDSVPSQNELSEYIEIVYGKQNVHKKFLELISKSKHNIYVISCPPYSIMNKKQSKEQDEYFEKFYERGGKDKVIFEVNKNSPSFIFEGIRESLDIPESSDFKLTNKSPIKLIIFDNETLMTFNKYFLVSGEELCASIIKQSNTVDTYVHMFDYLWNQAETFQTWLKNNEKLYLQKLEEFNQNKEED